MTTLHYKVGDRLPVLTATLEDRDGPVDLTGAAVRLHLRRHHDGEAALDRPAIVTDAEAGGVAYAWQEDDLNEAGVFDVEWLGQWVDGTMTFPNDRYGVLVVLPRLTE